MPVSAPQARLKTSSERSPNGPPCSCSCFSCSASRAAERPASATSDAGLSIAYASSALAMVFAGIELDVEPSRAERDRGVEHTWLFAKTPSTSLAWRSWRKPDDAAPTGARTAPSARRRPLDQACTSSSRTRRDRSGDTAWACCIVRDRRAPWRCLGRPRGPRPVARRMRRRPQRRSAARGPDRVCASSRRPLCWFSVRADVRSQPGSTNIAHEVVVLAAVMARSPFATGSTRRLMR